MSSLCDIMKKLIPSEEVGCFFLETMLLSGIDNAATNVTVLQQALVLENPGKVVQGSKVHCKPGCGSAMRAGTAERFRSNY